MKLLQIGKGAIGTELFPTYEKMAKAMKAELVVHDPGKGMVAPVDEYDVAFLAVPTEKLEDGSCDVSIVESAVDEWSKHCGVIVIKSTVPVGTTKRLNEKYGNLIFSPEFTSTNQHKGVQDFAVLGGKRDLCKKVARLYQAIKSADFRIEYTDETIAEMVKYTLNTFLALKVTFCNEINLACKAMGIEYEDVRNIWTMDSRINPAHTFVYEDKPYYDSHCFNKDVPAFVKQFDLPLMKAVNIINNEMKEKTNENSN